MSNTVLSRNDSTGGFWSRREAALNWLALGLLLAAWNTRYNEVADNVAPGGDATAKAQSRPEALRGYSYVSVRAVSRVADAGRQRR
jgi:hypothetical protein